MNTLWIIYPHFSIWMIIEYLAVLLNLMRFKIVYANDRLTEEDQTFLTILDLSDLDLDELVQLGQSSTETVKQRQYNVAAGAETLTRIISDRLSQRHYAVDFRVDGQRFFTFVKDDRDPSLIELEERSKGFQWFFSFDLMFMHESKGTFEGCVILLDEPRASSSSKRPKRLITSS